MLPLKTAHISRLRSATLAFVRRVGFFVGSFSRFFFFVAPSVACRLPFGSLDLFA